MQVSSFSHPPIRYIDDWNEIVFKDCLKLNIQKEKSKSNLIKTIESQNTFRIEVRTGRIVYKIMQMELEKESR